MKRNNAYNKSFESRALRRGAQLVVNGAMEDKHYITSIITILVGCGLLFWHKRFAATVVKEQNRMWGFHFGEREERISMIVAIIVGSGFLTIGILGLFGVIHWKPGTF